VNVRAPVVSVGAVAVQEGQLLLVRRGHGPAAGSWSVPGARVEHGETLHEAIVRAVLEEAGLRVVVDRFLGWAERIGETADDQHLVLLDFAVTALEPDAVPTAGNDAAEAVWVDLADLADYRLVPGLLDFLDDAGVLD
jgi:8-oxo-dGTP diphosphatase